MSGQLCENPRARATFTRNKILDADSRAQLSSWQLSLPRRFNHGEPMSSRSHLKDDVVAHATLTPRVEPMAITVFTRGEERPTIAGEVFRSGAHTILIDDREVLADTQTARLSKALESERTGNLSGRLRKYLKRVRSTSAADHRFAFGSGR